MLLVEIFVFYIGLGSYIDLIMQFLKSVFLSYSQSVQFVFMSYDFDVMIDICTEQDIRHKIFEHFSCLVNRN